MGPAAGPLACWASLFFPIGERFNLSAHYGSSNWTKPMACWTSLFFPIGRGLVFQRTMGPAAGPMACWTILFFPVGAVFFSSPRWVEQLDEWPAGQACSSQSGGGLILQPTMGPAPGLTACWTSSFFPSWERNLPAHYASSSWTNGLLDKLVLPNRGTNSLPAH